MCLKCIGQTDRHSNYRKIILTEKSRPKIWGIGVGLGGHWLRRARKISHENGQTCGQISAAGGSFPPKFKYAQTCYLGVPECAEAFLMHDRGPFASGRSVFGAIGQCVHLHFKKLGPACSVAARHARASTHAGWATSVTRVLSLLFLSCIGFCAPSHVEAGVQLLKV
jgi:hypothetical protein